MAKMYPQKFPKGNNSSGEKKVYEFFRQETPDSWLVLHSLRLPEHPNVVFGEADFVVIAPELGVFVLEVKSGGVGFDGSYWVYKDRYGKENKKLRSPFKQAEEGMFKVSEMLKGRLGVKFDRHNILYGYGVIFTDEENFPKEAIIEDEPWRLYQKSDGANYDEFIVRLANNFENELKKLRKRIPKKLSAADAENIRQCLRPEIDCIMPLKSFLDDSEEEIVRLTNEQYACLDDLRENERVVVLGGAGTGKTLIAARAARDAADEGIKVGMICFNRNLAEYLKYNLSEAEVQVSTLHSLMCKTVGMRGVKYDKDFFENELPRKATEALNGAIFDRIIVDEFQDICVPEYLTFLDRILKGGLRNGAFAFFGDFSGQAIYNKRASLANMKTYVQYYTVKRLTVNCRNTKFIGQEVVAVTGYNEQKYLLKVTGEPVDYIEWTDIEDEKEKLKNLLHTLKKQGISGESIVILSQFKRENSVIEKLDPCGLFVGDYGLKEEDIYAYFSTIYSFKGLESKVIILVDIESYDDIKLVYTALSRARSKLYVFETKHAYEQRKEKALRGTLNG